MATEAISKTATGLMAMHREHTAVSLVTVVALTALTTLALSHFFVGRKQNNLTIQLNALQQQNQGFNKDDLAKFQETLQSVLKLTRATAHEVGAVVQAEDGEEEGEEEVEAGDPRPLEEGGVGLPPSEQEEHEGSPVPAARRRRVNSEPDSPLPPVESTSALADVLDELSEGEDS